MDAKFLYAYFHGDDEFTLSVPPSSEIPIIPHGEFPVTPRPSSLPQGKIYRDSFMMERSPIGQGPFMAVIPRFIRN
jgi:hypothetical protein